MRILFVLEPVIFRNQPSFLAAHFMWVTYFLRYTRGSGGEFALAANPTTCDLWAERVAAMGEESRTFPLDPFAVLQQYDFDRNLYAHSLFLPSTGNLLSQELARVRELFAPDLAVLTSQNSHADRALSGLPRLYLEQAPLPRLGQPVRTSLEPCGHQVGSLIECYAAQIRMLVLSDVQRQQATALLHAIKTTLSTATNAAIEARQALSALAQHHKIALLVTQPVDWVTYEGALRPIAPENLLYEWAGRLPEGWIGVPTYHPGEKITHEMEDALARSCDRLRFLPQQFSQGMTDTLLLGADGMVTISSTSAMTGLLFGKKIIVTGQSPFRNWCLSDPQHLEKMVPLTEDEAVNTLCFLTNRYAEKNETLESDPAQLSPTLEAIIRAPGGADWFLDVSAWSLERAKSLFTLSADIKY